MKPFEQQLRVKRLERYLLLMAGLNAIKSAIIVEDRNGVAVCLNAQPFKAKIIMARVEKILGLNKESKK